MIIQALKKEQPKTVKKRPNNEDIIITKFETKVEYKDGCRIEKRVPKKVNITKKINETAKLVKTEQASAEEKLKELERVFSK